MERIVIRIRPGKIKGWMEVEISREMSSGVLPESGGKIPKHAPKIAPIRAATDILNRNLLTLVFFLILFVFICFLLILKDIFYTYVANFRQF